MYSVLIAEDELLIRMGLDASIPWNALGMQVTASVADGNRAWEAYLQYKPDIVLTDLRMPGLDGLEVIRRIRREDEDCRIVIITCIEEFDVLHEALKLGVSGYMCKAAMTREEIFSVLKKVRDDLDCKRRGGAATPSQSARAAQQLLSQYLLEGTLNENDYRAECESRGIAPAEPHMLIAARIDDVRPPLRQSVFKIVLERMAVVGESVTLFHEQEILMLLTRACGDESVLLHSVCGNIAAYLREVFGLTLRVTLCNLKQDAGSLHEWVDGCRNMLKKPYFYPDAFYVVEKSGPFYGEAVAQLLHRLEENPVCYGFSSGERRNRYMRALERVRRAFGDNRESFEAALTALYQGIYPDDVSKKPRNGKGSQQHAQNRSALRFINRPSAADALETLCETLPVYHKHPIYGCAITDTIAYMQENYHKNITLGDMAARINLSTNYYALLFKQTVGCNFTEFLTRLRLEQACELLRSGDLSVQQIAIQCGFKEVSYFTRCFKKNMGVPPRQWRFAI